MPRALEPGASAAAAPSAASGLPAQQPREMPIRTWNTLLATASGSDDSMEGLRLLQQILARGSPKANAATFLHALRGTSQRRNRWRVAMQMVGMLENWLRVSPREARLHPAVSGAFASAIAACDRSDRKEEASTRALICTPPQLRSPSRKPTLAHPHFHATISLRAHRRCPTPSARQPLQCKSIAHEGARTHRAT